MFSITAQSEWALDELATQGIAYDASIFPVHNYRYGIPTATRFPQHLSCGMKEFPPTTMRVAGVNVPMGGGFYARFWTYAWLHQTIRHLNMQGQPAVMYFHPWEFDPQQPRIHHESHWLARTTHYWRLASTRETLRRLLDDFAWTSIESLSCF